MPGGGCSCLDTVGCRVSAWPGHGQAVERYKPVQGGTRSQRRTGGVPGHLGHVGMYIPASTHTHLFMWPTCWAPVLGIRTPQTLTGIGFYVL
jgi:hypothetical protein